MSEMRKLTQEYNWGDTSLGSMENWPQSLKTVVGIILNSKFPMFIFWGPDSICFYNDAYRRSLGSDGKHPSALGKKAPDVWPEIWETIKPFIDQVLNYGEPVWSEDQLIPIQRNGKLENVYWTFSYSAILGENDKREGVLVTCMETTSKVENIKILEESADQLSFTIDAAELGTWDLNPATGTFTGNKRLKEWFGLEPESEIPLDIAINVMAPEDRERVSAAIQKAIEYESGGNYEIEYKIINPNSGIERMVRAKGKAVFNEYHIAERFSGILQDVTEQSISRKKIKISEQRFQAAVSAMDGILWTNNAEGKMVGEQPGWSKLTGQSFEEYQGYGWANVVHPDDAQPTIDAWNEAVNSHKTFIFQHKIKVASGEWEDFSIRAIPLVNSDGTIMEWVGVHTNVSEQIKSQKVLNEKNSQLIRINNELDNFIYTASHDLKSPVSNIEGLINALKDNLNEEECKTNNETELLLNLIETSIQRFKSTILDLTEISKLQNLGENEIEKLLVDEIMSDTLLNINDQYKESGAEIKSDFSEVQEIYFSKKNLKSIFYNLLSNSIKYRDHKKQAIINLKTFSIPGYTILTCTDNGLGISETNKDKMFSMFKRFHNHVEGTGIGLYIVKKIMDNAGGKIEVESQEGVGTTFKLYFKKFDKISV